MFRWWSSVFKYWVRWYMSSTIGDNCVRRSPVVVVKFCALPTLPHTVRTISYFIPASFPFPSPLSSLWLCAWLMEIWSRRTPRADWWKLGRQQRWTYDGWPFYVGFWKSWNSQINSGLEDCKLSDSIRRSSHLEQLEEDQHRWKYAIKGYTDFRIVV